MNTLVGIKSTMNNYFTRDHFRNKTIKSFASLQKEVIAFFNTKQLDICAKQLSEIASQVAEKAMEMSIPGTTCPKRDKDPDCFIPHLTTEILAPWEIKCTTGEEWRGGDFSKRPGFYVLISWQHDKQQGDIKIFAARLHMEEEDWIKSKPSKKSGSENYYATSFNKKNLLKYVTAGKAEVLCGNIYHPKYKSGKVRTNQVKLEREKIIIE